MAAKVQSALLEEGEERRVTGSGKACPKDGPIGDLAQPEGVALGSTLTLETPLVKGALEEPVSGNTAP